MSVDALQSIVSQLSFEQRLKLSACSSFAFEATIRWRDVTHLLLDSTEITIRSDENRMHKFSVMTSGKKTLGLLLELCPQIKRIYVQKKLNEDDYQILAEKAKFLGKLHISSSNFEMTTTKPNNVIFRKLKSLYVSNLCDDHLSINNIMGAHDTKMFLPVTLQRLHLSDILLTIELLDRLTSLGNLKILDLIGCIVDTGFAEKNFAKFERLTCLEELSLPPSFFSFSTKEQNNGPVNFRKLPVKKLSLYMDRFDENHFPSQLGTIMPAKLETLVLFGNYWRLKNWRKFKDIKSVTITFGPNDTLLGYPTDLEDLKLVSHMIRCPPYVAAEATLMNMAETGFVRWKFSLVEETKRSSTLRRLGNESPPLLRRGINANLQTRSGPIQRPVPAARAVNPTRVPRTSSRTSRRSGRQRISRNQNCVDRSRARRTNRESNIRSTSQQAAEVSGSVTSTRSDQENVRSRRTSSRSVQTRSGPIQRPVPAARAVNPTRVPRTSSRTSRRSGRQRISRNQNSVDRSRARRTNRAFNIRSTSQQAAEVSGSVISTRSDQENVRSRRTSSRSVQRPRNMGARRSAPSNLAQNRSRSSQRSVRRPATPFAVGSRGSPVSIPEAPLAIMPPATPRPATVAPTTAPTAAPAAAPTAAPAAAPTAAPAAAPTAAPAAAPAAAPTAAPAAAPTAAPTAAPAAAVPPAPEAPPSVVELAPQPQVEVPRALPDRGARIEPDREGMQLITEFLAQVVDMVVEREEGPAGASQSTPARSTNTNTRSDNTQNTPNSVANTSQMTFHHPGATSTPLEQPERTSRH